jgi:hypothetical protein
MSSNDLGRALLVPPVVEKVQNRINHATEKAHLRRKKGSTVNQSMIKIVNQSMMIKHSRHAILLLLHNNIPLALVDSENQIHKKQ